MKCTSEGCIQAMPRVLIDYLWQLAADAGDNACTFELASRHLGGMQVQDITMRVRGAANVYTVFGFTPLDTAVEVIPCGLDAVMAIAAMPHATQKGVYRT